MVRHVILWNLQAETPDEKRRDASGIKARLEALHGVIDGLIEIRVMLDPLASSTAEAMLDSLFADAQALAHYQTHPAHQEAAAFVRSVTKNRSCIDYEIG